MGFCKWARDEKVSDILNPEEGVGKKKKKKEGQDSIVSGCTHDWKSRENGNG